MRRPLALLFTFATAPCLAALVVTPAHAEPRLHLMRSATPAASDGGVTDAPANDAPDAAISCDVEYGGGPVVSNAKVVVVYWTTAVDDTSRCILPPFYGAITSSPYLAWLSEYDTTGVSARGDGGSTDQTIGLGSYAGAYFINPMTVDAGGTLISDGQIAAELGAQIAAGHLPQPQLDATGHVDTVYAFQFPPGVTITLGPLQSCVQFCSYHASTTAAVSGMLVPYTVVPDFGPSSGCKTGCSAGDEAAQLTYEHSFDLVEAITDTGEGDGWTAPTQGCGPIGSICETSADKQGVVDGYSVATAWSRQQHACVVGPAGFDGGTVLADAGTASCADPFDAGAADAAGADDAGLTMDAGLPRPDEAGAPPDASRPVDASRPSDGSGEAGAAGGASSDSGGCSCRAAGSERTAGGGLSWAAALAFAAACAARLARRGRVTRR